VPSRRENGIRPCRLAVSAPECLRIDDDRARPNTTRHPYPRSLSTWRGGAPRILRRKVASESGRTRAGVCPDQRGLESRCHHRDVVDTGTKPGADTRFDRAKLIRFLYSVLVRNRLDLFMCS
jgi:hypothetical protein